MKSKKTQHRFQEQIMNWRSRSIARLILLALLLATNFKTIVSTPLEETQALKMVMPPRYVRSVTVHNRSGKDVKVRGFLNKLLLSINNVNSEVGRM
jgi:hypothetical protein